ncbi:MAG: hypothetical protein JW704_01260 [Anaerolineaceae bacterium]|nr:hypothetical protein [Anaerolineaceae bacterium]MBN2677146.1 hypothetical protein [Anaerolineaceae bacterium]
MVKQKNEKPKKTAKKMSLTPLWNILAVIMLLGTCCMSSYVLVLLTNPYLPINPFPPSMTATPTPTATFTPRVFPATWTPTSTYSTLSFGLPVSSPTLQVIASYTPWPTITPLPPTATLPPGTYFSIRNTITAIPATDINSNVGCTWMGVGGVVTDLAGNPALGITLLLDGTLGFDIYHQTTLSGAAPQYGPGGYEFYLGGALNASEATLSIQILADDGKPVSEQFFFNTYSDCQRSLILIDFQQLQ